MKNKIQMFLSITLVMAILSNIVLNNINVASYYAETNNVVDIDYVGSKLPSVSTVSSKTISALKKSYSQDIAHLDNGADSKSIGLGQQAFDKLDNVHEDATYTGLMNLMFNTAYCDTNKLKKSFSLDEIPATEQLVKDYLYGGSYHDIATAIASTMKCTEYTVTLSNFNTASASITKNGYDYYGPFKVTDNTLGFSQVTCSDNVSLVSVTNNSVTETEYAENDKTYYLQVSEGEVVNTTLAFEGVHFNPALYFYSDYAIACGDVINKTFKVSLTLGNTAEEFENTDNVVNGSSEAGSLHNIVITNSKFTSGYMLLAYTTDDYSNVVCLQQSFTNGSCSFFVPSTDFTGDVVIYDPNTKLYSRTNYVSFKADETLYETYGATKKSTVGKKVVVTNLNKCASDSLGRLELRRYYTYKGVETPIYIGDGHAVTSSASIYSIPQNDDGTYTVELLDEYMSCMLLSTDQGYDFSKNVSYDDSMPAVEVQVTGDDTNCYQHVAFMLKDEDGMTDNFYCTFTYNGVEYTKHDPMIDTAGGETLEFTRGGKESFSIKEITMWHNGKFVPADFTFDSYSYNPSSRGSVLVEIKCKKRVADPTATITPTSAPTATITPTSAPTATITPTSAPTVTLAANERRVTVNFKDANGTSLPVRILWYVITDSDGGESYATAVPDGATSWSFTVPAGSSVNFTKLITSNEETINFEDEYLEDITDNEEYSLWAEEIELVTPTNTQAPTESITSKPTSTITLQPTLTPEATNKTAILKFMDSSMKPVKVQSMTYRVVQENGEASELQNIDVNDTAVTIKCDDVKSIAIVDVVAEGYTCDSTSLLVSKEESTFSVFMKKEMANVVLKISNRGDSKIKSGKVILTNQETQTEYSAEIADTKQTCSVAPGTYAATFRTTEEGYVVNSTQVDVAVAAGVENTIEFITTDVPGSAFISTRNSGGQPLASVEIYIDGNEDTTYTTDDSGVIEIKDLDYGKHTYTIVSVPDGYTLPATGTFTVSDNNEAVNVIISRRTGNLRVNKMVSGSNTIIKDAVYTITQVEAPYFKRTMSVREFPITLEAGDYTIKEIIPGEGYSFSEPRVQTITIPDDGTGQNVTFTSVGQTGSLLINNYAATNYNTKIEGVSYSLYDLDGEEVASKVSDSTGKVLIEGIPLGTYTLKQLEAPDGYVRYKKFTSVNISESGATVSLDAILAQVSGSITVYHESATAGILYYLHNSENELIDAVYTDSDGIALFNQLKPGTYTITCADANTNNDNTSKGLLGALAPITAYAYSGTVEVTSENLNVVVGSDKKSNVTSTQIGTSTIILSSKVSEYDKTVSGITSYGSVNVDSIATVINEKAQPLDTSADVTETAVSNVVDTEPESDDNDGNELTGVNDGTHYTTSAGNIIISSENQAIGDADFYLSEEAVSGLLNNKVKLPKTGLDNYVLYTDYVTTLCALALILSKRKEIFSLVQSKITIK